MQREASGLAKAQACLGEQNIPHMAILDTPSHRSHLLTAIDQPGRHVDLLFLTVMVVTSTSLLASRPSEKYLLEDVHPSLA